MKFNSTNCKKLAAGEVALENSGTLEQLREVLKYVFPKGNNKDIVGVFRFYYAVCCSSDWRCYDNTTLPTLPISAFYESFPKDDFGVIVENGNGKEIVEYLVSKGFDGQLLKGTLPNGYSYFIDAGKNKIDVHVDNPTFRTFTLSELKNLENQTEMKEINEQTKWCIKITAENIDVVGAFYDRNGAGTYTNNRHIGKYYTSHNLSSGKSVMGDDYGANFTMNKPTYEFPEITFERFKTQVMKEEEKEIVGWKLVKPEYEEAVKKITGLPALDYSNPNKEGNFAIRQNEDGSATLSYRKLKEAGVLELWCKPVYKESKPIEKIIDMGKFTLKVNKDGVWHKNENITRLFNELFASFNGSYEFGGYSFVLKDATFSKTGCENSETTLTQWKEVWAEYQKLKA